ncbi:MAG TPA: efflux RND transporter periplasmic adaptor subunit [Prolixibacteraceae bacterium]|nr:efflux RND transporter periplasmic adaptor subunit [Prolixibacteraceae bacterium]
MKDYKIFHKKGVKPALYVVGGLILGWLVFHHSEPATITEGVAVHQHSESEKADEIWTCAMHPQIRMDKPGKCPICGMELIPVQSATAELDPDAVQMTQEAIKLAEVQTTVIGQQNAQKEVSLYGKVQADERRVKTQAAHVPGRIEELLISFTGESVRKGQVIARIYSPSMITAQEELLQAKQLVPAQPALIEAAREKLRQWKLTSEQIEALEQSGKPQTVFNVTSNVSGIVLTKRVNQGDYVQQGTALFEVADLSNVWVLFDAYESDLPWIKKGSSVSFTLQSVPGRKFSGKISFIDPVINPATRVASVRVEASNPGGVLKPEMFVNGVVTSALPKYNDGIVIPQSAVLWTGPRSVVYIKVPGAKEPEFRMREIELGPALSNSYVVTSGLTIGEEIVTNGTFAVDASAQLAGKPSMMNPEGNQVSSGGMAGMDMGNGSEKKAKEKQPAMDMSTESKNSENKVNSAMDKKDVSKMANMETRMIKVSGNCDLCKERIETAAKSVSGVMTADWSAEKQMLNVEFDPNKTNSDSIQKAIAQVGHDTEKHKASDKVYEELPECCLYRK